MSIKVPPSHHHTFLSLARILSLSHLSSCYSALPPAPPRPLPQGLPWRKASGWAGHNGGTTSKPLCNSNFFGTRSPCILSLFGHFPCFAFLQWGSPASICTVRTPHSQHLPFILPAKKKKKRYAEDEKGVTAARLPGQQDLLTTFEKRAHGGKDWSR
ncbi:hypothetical protein BDB00DRAFT_799483 [Zychaea mexicana]|uniref:uncharacterized protein n=1 Tax=Zychaea mexicana TaxID=64656 RepID=UPI0022FE69B1|nr:uncharacterized protein BDB00DRAFT_799483 [Zychaea mexicana]KAI9498773.1 hypothetical protein BDB00DRAFT_799483 [Zychaea mexicana]